MANITNIDGDNQRFSFRIKGSNASGHRMIYYLSLILFIISCILLLPGYSQSDSKSCWDKPFTSPQYLLHSTGFTTTSSSGSSADPKKVDYWILYPDQAQNGKLETPAQDGKTVYTIDYSSGPYVTPREVCQITSQVVGPSVNLVAWVPAPATSFWCGNLDMPGSCRGSCPGGNPYRHTTWDGLSQYPNCTYICDLGYQPDKNGYCIACSDKICIDEKGNRYCSDNSTNNYGKCGCQCAKGYQEDNGECVSCEDICKSKKGVYDSEKSVANQCVCK